MAGTRVLRPTTGVFVLTLAASCVQESVDLSGRWVGTAEWVVDGEPGEMPLVFELTDSGENVEGTLLWGELRRVVTGASRQGPELRLESIEPASAIRFTGLFRAGAVEGRFAIQYAADPEPYPGRFRVEREP